MGISAIIFKEWKQFFGNSMGLSILALELLVSSICVFWGLGGKASIWETKVASLDLLFIWQPYILAIFTPALCMKIWSEEKREGTLEILLTLPFRDYEIVLGKFFSLFLFHLVYLFFTVPMALTLFSIGKVDIGILFSGYVGSLLLGMMFASISIYSSYFGFSSVSAFLFTFFSLLGFLFIDFWIPFSWIEIFSTQKNFDCFRNGVHSLSGYFFFLSVSALFLYFTNNKIHEERKN